MKSQLHSKNVIKIDIKDVIDYCKCPKYYELKKNDPNNYNLKEAYAKTEPTLLNANISNGYEH